MHQNKPGPFFNNLSGRATLLLSASPTIINSPLQNNTNNTTSSFSDDELPEDDSINFKKPQNEIFKKLDGKIQKIVAAHSNLNKLYALNDFSGVDPKKPFELPPQLPRPPPWVPKVTSDFGCNQWTEDAMAYSLNRTSTNLDPPELRQSSSLMSNKVTKVTPTAHATRVPVPQVKPSTLTIDSAISKLHQRRNQQQQEPPRPQSTTQHQLIHHSQLIKKLPPKGPLPGPSRTPDNTFARLEFAKKSLPINSLLNLQRGHQSSILSNRHDVGPEEKRRFQMELINIFRQEIAAVTKLAKLKFSPQAENKSEAVDPKSLLLQKSPQSLFNTIRRETSLLLNRNQPVSRSGSSLLVDQKAWNRRNENVGATMRQMPVVNKFQNVKVVAPPTEYFKHTCANSKGSSSENSYCNCFKSKSNVADVDNWCPTRKFTVKYRSLQRKLYQVKLCMDLAQKKDRNRIVDFGACKRSPQKSIDKIVDRLQARCLSSANSSIDGQDSARSSRAVSQSPSFSQSTNQKSTNHSPPSSPKPIPVCRVSTAKNYFIGNVSQAAGSRNYNTKSKNLKRLHHFGLKIGNYQEKEGPQPTNDKLTVEQFAKCLNLVRSNDASLQKHQEKLMQSESRGWRIPVSDRPLRLRRLRGERGMHMPASASYKATRRVGLQ